MVRLSPTRQHCSDDNTIIFLGHIKTYDQLSEKISKFHDKLEGSTLPQIQRGPIEIINKLKPFGNSIRMMNFHLKNVYTFFRIPEPWSS